MTTPSFLTRLHKSLRPIEADNNSFYRALAISEYNDDEFHKSIRYFVMEYFKDNSEKYIHHFNDTSSFWKCITENKSQNVWATDLSDMIIQAIPEILHIHLVIYDYDVSTDMTLIYTYGDESDKLVELMRTNKNHYDLVASA